VSQAKDGEPASMSRAEIFEGHRGNDKPKEQADFQQPASGPPHWFCRGVFCRFGSFELELPRILSVVDY
jgi:hypothetical protein